MAISKESVSKLTKKDEALVAEIEKTIDCMLEAKFRQGERLSIKLDDNLAPKVQMELVKRYKNAQWQDVEIKRTQKKGLNIVFK